MFKFNSHGSRLRDGVYLHTSGAVKLKPGKPGITRLPDGTIAASEQVAAALTDAYHALRSEGS